MEPVNYMLNIILGMVEQIVITKTMNTILIEHMTRWGCALVCPKHWTDVVNTTTHLINGGMYVLLGFKIFEEECSGKEAQSSH